MVSQSVSLNDGTLATYSYDALGQLIRVNDPHENATWVYNYDCGGNILSKVKYAYTTGTLGTAQQTILYTYGDSNWKDKLTAYDGKTITYDAIGNPTNDGTWTYTWQAGRQLKQMSKTGTTIRYEYNHDGLRTQKFVDANNKTDATYYTYNGKNIIHVIKNSDHLHIFYDAQNRPAKVSHNGVFYTYIYNLQGDIVGLVDKDGALVVEYKYDAWGKPISTTGTLAGTLGKLNPFRYRGYVYDDETGLHYLRSRYYNPVWMRFVNEDVLLDSRIFGANLYAYCRANPVLFSDSTGKMTRNYSQRILLAYLDGVGKISLGTSGVPTGASIKYTAEKTVKALEKAVDWLVDTAKQIVVDLMQTGIETAQVDYFAYCNIENFLIENGPGIVQGARDAYDIFKWATTGLDIAGIVSLPKPIVFIIWVIDTVDGLSEKNKEGWQ